jgi:hypothetical protein
MAALVASDALIEARVTTLQTLLNSGHTLRLFANDFTPDPASVLGDFTESSFTGYAPESLSGLFGSPVKITDGEWQIQTDPIPFSCSGGSPQVVYGAYVDDGADVIFSARFDAPITMTSGASFTLQLSPQGWAKVLL